jgi:nucleoside-diphosphate-sugar epimerase
MTIFVTGATGFIGSHFLRVSLEAGHNIVALRRSPASRPRIPINNEEQMVASGQLQWLNKEMAKVSAADLQSGDIFVHLAAAGVSPQHSDWSALFQTNVTDSLALWLEAVKAGIKRFVICGSCFEYGLSGERYDFIPVDAPLEPTTPYAASKAAATMAAIALAHTHQLHVSVARPFHVFGEGESEGRFWPSLRRAAHAGIDFPMTHGEQVRDFIPVENVATRFLDESLRLYNISTSQRSAFTRVFNIGTGHPRSLKQFAALWWNKWDTKGKVLLGAVPYRSNEIMRLIPLVD